ncbi:hypothetical protein ACZ92_21490 [Vibrio parahaemolyticus]|nr:hypothetical protein ACZ92_21490 [Vibrio parahaemolyticus]
MKSIASYQIKFKVLFTLTCSCIFATACNSDNTSTEIQSKLLVEKDFANNSRLRANPEQGTVILFLEPPLQLSRRMTSMVNQALTSFPTDIRAPFIIHFATKMITAIQNTPRCLTIAVALKCFAFQLMRSAFRQ